MEPLRDVRPRGPSERRRVEVDGLGASWNCDEGMLLHRARRTTSQSLQAGRSVRTDGIEERLTRRGGGGQRGYDRSKIAAGS